MSKTASALQFASAMQENTLKASKGIVLYEARGGNQAFATLHSIRVDDEGRPSFLPGQAMTREMLFALASKLMPDASYDYLPPEILSLGHGWMVWWCQGGPRNLFFRTDAGDPIGERTLQVDLPPLVFAAKNESLSVFSLAKPERPMPDTPLFMAPFYNVWTEGNLCRGNARLPDRSGPEAIGDWENMFFNSSFTHPNSGSEKLSRHPKGLKGLWHDLSKQRWKNFPIKMLAPAKMTLSDLVQSMKRG